MIVSFNVPSIMHMYAPAIHPHSFQADTISEYLFMRNATLCSNIMTIVLTYREHFLFKGRSAATLRVMLPPFTLSSINISLHINSLKVRDEGFDLLSCCLSPGFEGS